MCTKAWVGKTLIEKNKHILIRYKIFLRVDDMVVSMTVAKAAVIMAADSVRTPCSNLDRSHSKSLVSGWKLDRYIFSVGC